MNILSLFRRKPYTVEMFPDQLGYWHWRIRHKNTEILCTSEAYASKDNARQTATRLACSAGFALIEVTPHMDVKTA